MRARLASDVLPPEVLRSIELQRRQRTEDVSLVLVSAVGGAPGGEAVAAWTGAGLARSIDQLRGAAGVLVVGEPRERPPRPTLIASVGANRLERDLRERFEAPSFAARGSVCWADPGHDGAPELLEGLAEQLVELPSLDAIVAWVEPGFWERVWEGQRERVNAVILRSDLPASRAMTGIAAATYRRQGAAFAIARNQPGPVAARRARAGLGVRPPEQGGSAPQRVVRWLARQHLGDEAGQAVPIVLAGVVVVLFAIALFVAIGGAVTARGQAQRTVDLAAVSAAHSMHDDLPRLLAPPRLADQRINPNHLEKAEYLGRARRAARIALSSAEATQGARVSFPDRDSFAPLQVRVSLRSQVRVPPLGGRPRRGGRPVEMVAVAVAETGVAWGPAQQAGPGSGEATGAPGTSGESGYAGPLELRQGHRMRPDVAAAFDRLARAAAGAGLPLVINSAFRSDAEQARLFAANPDPRWVARPGTSLHRCGTELDLGPSSAYSWLAAEAARFGFTQRYSWEPWHYGFDAGPPPCSPPGRGNQPGSGAGSLPGGAGSRADGRAAGRPGLPGYVPARYRRPLVAAASRWGVSAALLAAQLMAESNFNPFAVSGAGAQGIAQFIPTTAAAYGLRDPFDPDSAIDAQAHLMSDLLRRYEGSTSLALAAYNAGPGAVDSCGCVPAYPETQAYVTRILGLLEGSGATPGGLTGSATVGPAFEVRLVR